MVLLSCFLVSSILFLPSRGSFSYFALSVGICYRAGVCMYYFKLTFRCDDKNLRTPTAE
jgi:hypothetical protein